MPDFEKQTVVLQVIPQMETGGAEQTTLDISQEIISRGWSSLVVSQGGRMVEGLEQQGATHISLPVASKNPLTINTKCISAVSSN